MYSLLTFQVPERLTHRDLFCNQCFFLLCLPELG